MNMGSKRLRDHKSKSKSKRKAGEKEDRRKKRRRHDDDSNLHRQRRDVVKGDKRRRGDNEDKEDGAYDSINNDKESEQHGASVHRDRVSIHNRDRKHKHEADEYSSSSNQNERSKEMVKEERRSRKAKREGSHERSHERKKKGKKYKRKDSRERHHHSKDDSPGRHSHKHNRKEKSINLPSPPRDLFQMGKPRGFPPEKDLDPEGSYFEYHAHLRLYLFRRDGTMFEDLSSEEARKQFENFVKEYNKGLLEEGFYQDAGSIPSAAMEQCKRTKHSWQFNTSTVESRSLSVLRHGVKKQTEYREDK